MSTAETVPFEKQDLGVVGWDNFVWDNLRDCVFRSVT